MNSLSPQTGHSVKKATEARGGRSVLRVIDHVNELVAKGELRPGSRLPAERDLALRLQISRSSLRSGLCLLSAVGVLESRHGLGTFLSKRALPFKRLSWTALSTHHTFLPWQITEAMGVLEGDIATLAARRATKDQIAELADGIADMYSPGGDEQSHAKHSHNFMRTLAKACGNPILGALMESILAIPLVEQDCRQKVSVSESVRVHREIFKAVRSRDAEGAKAGIERYRYSKQTSGSCLT